MTPPVRSERRLTAGAGFGWVDRLLPAELRQASPEELGRARLVILALIPFFIAAIPVTAEYYFGGSHQAAWMIVVVVFAACWTPAVLRFGTTVVAHYQLGLFVVLMSGLSWFSGGLGAPPLYAFVLIPIIGVALLGRSAAIAWSVVACLILGTFLGLELAGRSPPTDVAPDALTRGHAVLGILGIAVALAFTLLQDAHRRRVLVELEGARIHAEVANRAKSAFLANVGHELRTPMTGVLGMSSLLQRAEIAPDHREMAAVIETSAASLLALLDDILDYAQLEVGQLRVEANAFDVRAMVHESVALVAPLADRRGLRLRHAVDPGVPMRLVGDARRCRQILLNLLGNAIKFTDEGHVALDVTLQSRGDDTLLVLRVEDSGRGIPEEARARIFERFERVHEPGHSPVAGSGLGLAICRSLLELMNGEMELTSRQGAGSCFVVKIPMAVSPEQDAPVSHASGGDRLPESLRVLVADDNDISRLVVRRMLETLGCRVTLAEDGAACLARVAEEPFDAVLMDCQMPHMDGLEATRAIRAAPESAALPVLGLTASRTAEQEERCFAAGMDEVLGKPCTIDELRDALRRRCGLRKTPPA